VEGVLRGDLAAPCIEEVIHVCSEVHRQVSSMMFFAQYLSQLFVNAFVSPFLLNLELIDFLNLSESLASLRKWNLLYVHEKLSQQGSIETTHLLVVIEGQ